MIESSCGNIEYDETGKGPTIVLAPGSCSTGAAWRPIVAHLENDFRCVTTSLLGYGRTAERRTAGNKDISLEAEVLEQVIARAGGPVHLVGHSFGGLTALAVAIRNHVPLLSLTIIEAPAPDVLRQAGEHGHYQTVREMTEAYSAAFQAGEAAAIEMMIDFYGGAGTFASWPERMRAYAVRSIPVNLMDWQTAYGFELSSTILAKVDVPTLVLCGESSHPAIQRANGLIAEVLSDASMTTLAGAAHFMIATHPKEVAGLIAGHLAGTKPVLVHQ